jgi:putative transcriptional regulator
MNPEDFEQLLQSLEEAGRWLDGEDVPGIRVHSRPAATSPQSASIPGLSQADFARQIGVCVETLCQWETGRRCPTGPVRTLLALLDKYPEIVSRTLSEAA